MSTVIRSLMIKVGADLTDMQKNFKQISKDLKNAGKDLSSAGSTLTKGITMPAMGAIAGLTGLAVSAASGADELITLSNKTGLTTQELQELEYASRFVDVEVETMTSSMMKLTKSMSAAKTDTSAQAQAFKELGIETTNADGSMRNAKEVWAEALEALGGVANETERNALSMELFGKSAAELNPLIAAGGDELNRLKKEAHDVGAVMSDENVNALGKFDDSLQQIQAVLKTAGAELGAAFLPVLEKLTPIIKENLVPAMKSAADTISNLVEGFGKMTPEMQNATLAVGALILAAGPIISIAGGIASAVSFVTAGMAAASAAIAGGGGMAAAISAFLGPAGIAIAVVGALAAAAFLIIKNWDSIKEFFSNLWDGVSKAFSSAWSAIEKGYNDAIEWFRKLPIKIKEFFEKLPENLGYIFGLAIGNIVKFGVNLGEWIKTEVPKAIGNMVAFFKELPGKILNSLSDAITNLGIWTTNMITTAKVEIPKFVTSVVDGIKEIPKKMLSIGKDIVTGLWSGVQEKITWLSDKVKEFTSGFTKGIKNALGINSPSKVMASEVGRWIPAGIADGITNSKGLIDKAMDGLKSRMTTSTIVNANGVGNGMTIESGSSTTNLYLDSKKVATATGKVQFNRNSSRSRGMGVIPI